MNLRLNILASCLLAAMAAHAQTSAPQTLRASIKPDEVLRYEVEASTSFFPQTTEGVKTETPLVPCDYAVRIVVALQPKAPDKDGNTPVLVNYSDARVTNWHCDRYQQNEFQKALDALQSSTSFFQIGPHTEVAATQADEHPVQFWAGMKLIRKVTLDLLQTQFTDRPVAVGDSWKPRGQFLYWKDYLLANLDMSAATSRWRDTVDIAGQPCAWITSKYVFSPLDIPAGATTRSGRARQAGTNAVSAVANVSMLLDTNTHHIAWMQRSQQVDNRLKLDPQSDEEDESEPLATLHFEEQARSRLIRQQGSIEWMTALKHFEESPSPKRTEPQPVSAGSDQSLGQIARLAKSREGKHSEELESLEPTPHGFTRWEKELCENWWSCTSVSVAMAGKVEVSEDSALNSVYLAKVDGTEASLSIGPLLDRKYQGLTPDEELKKYTTYYLSNRLWMANGAGVSINERTDTLDGYDARISTFTAPRRDQEQMSGTLVLLLTPWGKVVPVGCAYEQHDAAKLQSVCEQIIASIRLHR